MWREDREKKENKKRNSKDKILNKKERRLVEFLEKKGLSIMNRDMERDEEREYTFTGGRGNTVIDYVIRGEEVRARVESLIVGDEVDSDYHPLIVSIKEKCKSSRGKKKVRAVGVYETRRVYIPKED